MRTVITTVGTSLLKNAAREMNVAEPCLKSFLSFCDPKMACAETNSLSRILRDEDSIVFIYSQTEKGRQCAEALEAHFSAQGYMVRISEIPDLCYYEGRFKLRGLRSLVDTIIELIEQERGKGNQVAINTTAGFKAEAAYATLVGLIFDVPVYYIHEAFEDIIEMPPLPIQWDFNLIVEQEHFFDWLAADLRRSGEVDRKLRDLPPEIRMLLCEEEGYTFLSPAGEVFYQAYKARMVEAMSADLMLSSRAQETYDSLNPQKKKLTDRYLRRLLLPEWRQHNSEQKENSDCLGAPQGNCDIRFLYYVGDRNGVWVVEIADHDDYELLLKEGVFRKNYPAEKFSKFCFTT